jgi:two-component system OmpR family sensor kinase
MGRLFWKFFILFWTAALLLAVSVGSLIFIQHHATHEYFTTEFDNHQLLPNLKLAAELHKLGGLDALENYLTDLSLNSSTTILAIDAHHQDILNRPVPDTILQLIESDSVSSLINSHSWHDNSTVSLFSPELLSAFHVNSSMVTTSVHPANDDMFNRLIASPSRMVMLLMGVLLIAILFSGLLAWYLTRPIRTLRHAFISVAQGNLKTRIGHLLGYRHDELSDLGKQFDHMAAQIEQLVTAQQSLLHDVSHELRSPLARLEAAIGLAEQDPSDLKQTFSRIHKETDRIDQLVAQLLVLSRMSSGLSVNNFESVKLTDLLKHIVEDAQFEADSKHILITLDLKSNITLTGDVELLHRAIENILRNAIKFSPEQSMVLVEAIQNDAEIVLRIQDQGPGVPETAIEHLFTPFYKAPSIHRNQGNGLGMAISKRAIESHGGRVIAFNRIPTGLCVEMILPLQNQLNRN